MQGAKGLANGLDLLGKMVMAIQWLGYKNKQLKILFGGGLANVDGAPSLERWVVTLWWCFKKRPIIIKQPYSIQKGFEMCGKREVWVERLDTCRDLFYVLFSTSLWTHNQENKILT